MWLCKSGLRTIIGSEAILVREAISLVVDLVDDDDSWEFNVPIFDSLQPEQKLAVLAQFASFVFAQDAPAPQRTAVLDAAVAVVYGVIDTLVAAEIEEERLSGKSVCSIRGYLRRCCMDFDWLELPTETCPNVLSWVALIRALEDQVMWNSASFEADLYLDADPDTAHLMRTKAGLDDGYFTAIAPDPSARALAEIRQQLDHLSVPSLDETSPISPGQ